MTQRRAERSTDHAEWLYCCICWWAQLFATQLCSKWMSLSPITPICGSCVPPVPCVVIGCEFQCRTTAITCVTRVSITLSVIPSMDDNKHFSLPLPLCVLWAHSLVHWYWNHEQARRNTLEKGTHTQDARSNAGEKECPLVQMKGGGAESFLFWRRTLRKPTSLYCNGSKGKQPSGSTLFEIKTGSMFCPVLSVHLSVCHTYHTQDCHLFFLPFVAAFFFESSSSTKVHFRDMCISFELDVEWSSCWIDEMLVCDLHTSPSRVALSWLCDHSIVDVRLFVFVLNLSLSFVRTFWSNQRTTAMWPYSEQWTCNNTPTMTPWWSNPHWLSFTPTPR